MWIFGYGSIIFRPAFAYVERRRAFVHGYARRLWQGSPDHRGVPEAPGLVATLIPLAGNWVGGVAFRLDEAGRGAILAALNHREKAGFRRSDLPIHEPGGPPFGTALGYVAREENPYFLGPLAEPVIASTVAERRGPSGPNEEYVLRLAAALAKEGIEDAHVQAVARALGAPARGAPSEEVP